MELTIWFDLPFAEPSYWINNVQNILWLRNHVVAPLSEEFTFRACMMPLLLQSFKPLSAVLLTPLFFGVAHLHHMIERLRSGMDFKTAFIISGKRKMQSKLWFLVKTNLTKMTSVFRSSISIRLHRHLWNVFSIFVCSNWSFYRSLHGSRILQSHGISWCSGSAEPDG